MEKIILQVTKEDLNSEYDSVTNCAVARASQRYFGRKTQVGGSKLRSERYGKHDFTFDGSIVSSHYWNEDTDQLIPVEKREPFELELTPIP